MVRLLLALGCFLELGCATARAGEPVALTGEHLKQMVPGSAIALDTPLNTVVPIRFGTDGLMTGEAGSLASYLGAERDRGRWWVTGDTLCLKWFRWFDAEQRCLTLRQDGDHILWQEPDGKTGTATITSRAPSVPAKPETVVASVAATPPQVTPVAPVPVAPVPLAAPAPASPPSPFGPLTIISRAEAATPLSRKEATAQSMADEQSVEPEPAAVKPKPAKTKAVAKPAPGKVTAKDGGKLTKLAGKLAGKSPAGKGPAKTIEPTYQVAGVEEDDVLNIRNGPSEDDDAVGAIPPAARGVKIVGACEDDWCPVTHGNSKGWVNRYYLAPEVKAEGKQASSRADAAANRDKR